MTAKTILSENDITRILATYNLGEHFAATPYSAGAVQSPILISTSMGKFVLRNYTNRSMEHVMFEANILAYLHKHAYHSPKPLRNKLGRFVGTYRGIPYMLIGFIEGEHREEPSCMQITKMAKAAASLHNLTKGYKPAYWQAREGHDIQFCWQAANLQAKTFTPRKKAKQRLQWLEKELASLQFPNSLPKGVCHCDFHPTNLLFKGDNLSGVIDFDDACYTYLIYDVANLIDYWAPPYQGKRELATARFLLAEYQKHRTLNDSEKHHLYDALKMQILIDSVWYFGRGEDGEFIEKKKIDLMNDLGSERFYDLLFV